MGAENRLAPSHNRARVRFSRASNPRFLTSQSPMDRGPSMSRRVLVSPNAVGVSSDVNVERDDKDDSSGIGNRPRRQDGHSSRMRLRAASRCSRDVGLWPMLSKKSAVSGHYQAGDSRAGSSTCLRAPGDRQIRHVCELSDVEASSGSYPRYTSRGDDALGTAARGCVADASSNVLTLSGAEALTCAYR